MNYWFWIPFRLMMIAGVSATATLAYIANPIMYGWLFLSVPCSILYFFFQTQEENHLKDEVKSE